MENAIVAAISGPEIIALLALIAANLILSIVAALAKGVFTFRKLADFIPTRVMPLFGYLVVAALADIVDGWDAVAIAIYAGLAALYTAGILAGLKSLTGLKIPDVISEKDRKPK